MQSRQTTRVLISRTQKVCSMVLLIFIYSRKKNSESRWWSSLGLCHWTTNTRNRRLPTDVFNWQIVDFLGQWPVVVGRRTATDWRWDRKMRDKGGEQERQRDEKLGLEGEALATGGAVLMLGRRRISWASFFYCKHPGQNNVVLT